MLEVAKWHELSATLKLMPVMLNLHYIKYLLECAEIFKGFLTLYVN